MTSPDSPAVDVVPMPSAAGAPTVVGLDLSLTSTGISIADGNGDRTTTHRTAKLRDTTRLRAIVDEVLTVCSEEQPSLVVVEGPSFGSVGSAFHQLGGLWWMVASALDAVKFPRAVVAPSAVKKYATGKGNVGKDEMIVATCRRFPGFDGDNNAADALWLAAMGADHLGSPLVAMPAANRAALDKVQWPVTA